VIISSALSTHRTVSVRALLNCLMAGVPGVQVTPTLLADGRRENFRYAALGPPVDAAHGVGNLSARLAIAAGAYTMECMAGLYEAEVEPEVRSWLASLPDRDFGRVDLRRHTPHRA
jgi:hypothetical protein